MPIVQIHLKEGRTADQKRRAAKEITDCICNCFDVKAPSVRIVFSDMKKEDFAIGGKLWLDD